MLNIFNFIKKRYFIISFFFFLFFSNCLFGQSVFDNGFILFEKNKGKIEIQEDIFQLINSFSNRLENKNGFEFRSEIVMYALLYENHRKINESIELLSYLSKDLNIDNKIEVLDLIKIQFKIGLLYENIDIPDSANIKFEECILLLKESYGIKNDLYLSSLQESANCLSDLFQFDKSKVRFEEALKGRRELFQNDINKITRLMNDMALNLHRMGEFDESIKLNKECLEIRYKNFGESYPGYMMTLNNLASDYLALGDYQFSIELNQKCLELRKKYLGENHDNTLMSLNNLGTIFYKIGNYEIAKKYFEEVLLKLENNGKKNSVEYISTSLGLSDIYECMDLYGKSLEIRNLCLEINDKIGNTSSFIYTSIITKLSESYYNLGFLDKAEEKLLECLAIREKLVGTNHLQYSETLSNLAMLYKASGKYDKSLEYIDKSSKIDVEKYGENHADYYYLIALKAQLYSDMGSFEKAIFYANQALKGYQNIFGKESERYASVLGDLGYYQTRIKRFDIAEKTLTNSLNIKKKIFPIENSAIENAYNNIATVQLLNKNYKSFFEHQNFILESIRKEFNSNQLILTNEQKESFKYKLSYKLLSLISVFAKPQINSAVFQEDILNFWFDSNGLLSTQKSEIQSQLNQSDTIFKRLLGEYKQSNSIYNYYKERPNEYAKKAGVNIENLKKDADDCQKNILKLFDKYQLTQKEINFNSIKNSLSENELYIEIIRIPSYDYLTNKWIDSSNYVGLLVRKKDERVEVINIDNSYDFDKIIFPSYWNSIFVDKKDRNSIDSTGQFYRAFWKPFEHKTEKFHRIYITLSGVYNNINLNTLHNPETGKYLIEEKDIRIVNSARDFVLNKENEKKTYTSNTASLFGFPNFDGSTTLSTDTLSLIVVARDLNSFWLDSLNRGGMKAKPLPATKTEVENISSSLKSKGWQVNSFLADNAAEINIKKQQSPRILHIATHGYFFKDVPTDKEDNRFLGMDRNRVAQDPMLRSGLLFTGANRTLQGEEPIGENGLLSAAEASLLNLRETELVVLSACETGRGEVKNGEGVYGLRKAFADAGAKNIIMSLWKVDDKVTQEFMTTFYTNWLNDKSTIREAFNKTQLEIKAKYPQPYYWGAFILVGE